MQGVVIKLGRITINKVADIGYAAIFLLRTLVGRPKLRSVWLLIEQLFYTGFLSLIIIICAGVFIGMVLGLQSYTMLQKFGAESALGQLIALSIVRELGPVISALLFAGRAGSALTAEIGLMQATDQIESLQLMAVDPLRRIIAPRFLAGIISMPILSIIFCAVAIWGGYLVVVQWLHVDGGTFWANMQAVVEWRADIMNGIIKTFCFGFVVSWIAVLQGFTCIPTAEGISQATTKTVVYASLAILGLDFILTALMFGDLT